MAGTVLGGAPDSSGQTPAARGEKAPRPWRSYPLNQVESNLAAQARQDACDFAARQRPRDRPALLIFLIGRANEHLGKFGVGADDDFRPNNRVFEVLRAAGQAYEDCRPRADMKVDIAYGLTNYELSRSIQTNASAWETGRAQARVVRKLRGKLPRGVSAAAAADIEPGWDRRGSGRALSLIRGGARPGFNYYNLGTSGRCPPYGRACQGNWTPLDIARGSQDQQVIPLPQIYYPNQARAWAHIANRWDGTGGNCPKRKRKRHGCYDFGGATSHPTDCAGVEFTPQESWRRIRQATDNDVGRRLIYFNPRRVSCRSSAAGEPREAPRTRVSLPLMPNDVPGEVVEDPDPIASEYVMGSLRNAWRAGNERELTWVYAGAAFDPGTGNASPSGRLLVVREDYGRHRLPSTSTERIDVAGSGPLRIVDAPLGSRAIEAANQTGGIAFESASGTEGVLDLSTGSVSLTSEP